MPTPDGAYPSDTLKNSTKNMAPLLASQKALHSIDKQLRELRCYGAFIGAKKLAEHAIIEARIPPT